MDVSNIKVIGSVLARVNCEADELVLDLTRLSFIDVAGTAQLVALARRLGPDRGWRSSSRRGPFERSLKRPDGGLTAG